METDIPLPLLKNYQLDFVTPGIAPA